MAPVVRLLAAIFAGAFACGLGPFARAQRIVAESLPDPGIPNFHFPESEATVLGWTSAAITPHAWGLWTALTAQTTQREDGQPLRVFETWYTPEDLLSLPDGTALTALSRRVRAHTPLRRLDQLRQPENTASNAENDRAVGYIKYDPTSAQHILTQGLLHASTLQALLDGGASSVPPFPASSLVVKPIFEVFSPSSLVAGRYLPLKVWTGPPLIPQAFGPAQWTSVAWIDVQDGGDDSGAVDTAPAADGSTRTDATTYPLSAFLWVRLSAAEAAGLNADKPGSNAFPGDFALLVGMHVAGREIARWTWQTFWWTPAPDSPPAPSSAEIAAERPAQLSGAPRHYAMATAYAMEAPSQPETGGENAGRAVYAYNPWVEAAFAPSDLPDSLPGLDSGGMPAANRTGVQSNCMSCHVRATYNPSQLSTAPRFSGARYTDLGDPAFVGTLQVDFLWSLPRNAQ